MALSVEWRVTSEDDALVVVDDAIQQVSQVVTPDAHLLMDYLAVTGDLTSWSKWPAWRLVGQDAADPDTWGAVVMERADDGQVLFVNPELYWEGVRRWFRSRGVDYDRSRPTP